MSLSEKNCIPCKGGVAALDGPQVAQYLRQVSGWETNSEGTAIVKKIKFRNFISSLAFVNKVGDIAEKANHHPDIAFGWGYCHITLNTHSIGGLHENDFIVAARIDALSDEE